MKPKNMHTASRVIINADDLGETEEITKGILQGIDAGVVTSTTILANMPATDFAVSEAVRRQSIASFGVHLNMCEGRPLTKPESFIQSNGSFLSKRSFALAMMSGRLDMNELEIELTEQTAKIHDRGIRISHLDSHKHLHQLPGVKHVVSSVAKKFGIERIRCTIEGRLWTPGLSLNAWISRIMKIFFAYSARRCFESASLRFPQRVLDVRQLVFTKNESSRFSMMRSPKRLTELICHPGTPMADIEKPGSCNRDEELRFLQSAEFRNLIDTAPLKLVTYWDC